MIYNDLDQFLNKDSITNPVKINSGNVDSIIASGALPSTSIEGGVTKTYSSSSAPTSGMNIGDMWYDTDDNNHAYRWDGSSWISVKDTTPGTQTLDTRGFTNGLTFSSTGYSNITWTSGTLTFADGSTYSISSGSNNNTSTNPVYIYLNTDVSTTVLQVTTTASSAVGANKCLVCVKKTNSYSSKKAIFQVMGGADSGVFITADNIAANTITANEIAANTITTNRLSATAIDGMTINGATINAKSGATTIASLDSGGLKVYGQYATWYSSGGTAVGQIYASSTSNLQIYTYSGKTLELGGANGASLNAGDNNCELRTGNSAHIQCSNYNYGGFVGTSSKVFSNMYATTYYLARSGQTTRYLQLGSSGVVEMTGAFYVDGQIRSGQTSIQLGGWTFQLTNDPDAPGKYYLRTA